MLNTQAVQALADRIENAEHIALIVHVNPDADSMGSACALYAHLLRDQKKITLFCATEQIDRRLSCIPWSEKVTGGWDGSADLAIALDCGSYARMGIAPECDLVNIDHHGDNDGFGDLQLIDTEAVSATMVLYKWFTGRGIKINPKMATALYAGLAEDSLGFTGRRTDAGVFETAAELARFGADISQVNDALFLRQPLSALRLKGRMLDGLELQGDGRIALLIATQEMIARSGANADACSLALHDALGLPTVRVAVMLHERGDGSVKGLLRTNDGIDVRKIAVPFGGGGHHYAAGFNADYPIDAVAAKVVTLIKKEFE